MRFPFSSLLFVLFLSACGATVTSTSSRTEPDAATPSDNDVAADAGTTNDSGPAPDPGGCYPLGRNPTPPSACTPGCWYRDGSPEPYHGPTTGGICVRTCNLSGQLSGCWNTDDAGAPTTDATTDAPVRWPVTARVSPVTPASRSIPRNATGVHVATFDFTSTGDEVPSGLLRLRRVGVGPSTDIANVYRYGVTRGSVANTPFRYSSGRDVNPATNEITIPFPGVSAGATGSMEVYLDLGAATVGAQHAIELIGVDLENGAGGTLFVPFTAVRSNFITISPDLAGRLDVQRGSVIGRINPDRPGEGLGSCRLRANRHDLDIVRFSFAVGGTINVGEQVTELELWRGQTRIPISEWSRPLNGAFVLSPVTPIRLAAGTEDEFRVLGRVRAPSGRTIRMYLEHPTDIHVIDRTLDTPAAVCIASTATGGCDGPNQGSFDGTPGNATETVVDP